MAEQSLTLSFATACSLGAAKTVQDLLRQNAAFDINSKDTTGRTLLHYASAAGHLDVCLLLCSRGAKLNIQDQHGWTPMFWAVAMERVEVVELLHDFDPDLNIKTTNNLGLHEFLKYHGNPPRSSKSHSFEKMYKILFQPATQKRSSLININAFKVEYDQNVKKSETPERETLRAMQDEALGHGWLMNEVWGQWEHDNRKEKTDMTEEKEDLEKNDQEELSQFLTSLSNARFISFTPKKMRISLEHILEKWQPRRDNSHLLTTVSTIYLMARFASIHVEEYVVPLIEISTEIMGEKALLHRSSPSHLSSLLVNALFLYQLLTSDRLLCQIYSSYKITSQKDKDLPWRCCIDFINMVYTFLMQECRQRLYQVAINAVLDYESAAATQMKPSYNHSFPNYRKLNISVNEPSGHSATASSSTGSLNKLTSLFKSNKDHDEVSGSNEYVSLATPRTAYSAQPSSSQAVWSPELLSVYLTSFLYLFVVYHLPQEVTEEIMQQLLSWCVRVALNESVSRSLTGDKGGVSRWKGVQIRMNLESIEDWCRQMGSSSDSNGSQATSPKRGCPSVSIKKNILTGHRYRAPKLSFKVSSNTLLRQLDPLVEMSQLLQTLTANYPHPKPHQEDNRPLDEDVFLDWTRDRCAHLSWATLSAFICGGGYQYEVDETRLDVRVSRYVLDKFTQHYANDPLKDVHLLFLKNMNSLQWKAPPHLSPMPSTPLSGLWFDYDVDQIEQLLPCHSSLHSSLEMWTLSLLQKTHLFIHVGILKDIL